MAYGVVDKCEDGAQHVIGCEQRAYGGGIVTSTNSADAVIRAVQARQQFWIEERDRARWAKKDYVAGEAQKLIDEYDVFIEILKHRSEQQLKAHYAPDR